MRPTVWLLILSALPISMALRWTAVHFPISPREYWIHAVWIDDRYCVVQHQYNPRRWGVWRPYQCVFREYLLDCENHTCTKLEGAISKPDYWPALPEISPDGDILRLFRNENGWILNRINPTSLKSQELVLGDTQPYLVGKRYLVTQAWDKAAGRRILRWHDLLEESPQRHSVPLETYGRVIQPVDGTSAFYLTSPSVEDLEDSDDYGVEDYSDEQYAGAPWFDELKHPDELTPRPAAALRNAIEITTLYSMSERGPSLIARWPSVGGSGLVMTQCSDGYISSLRIDATSIDVRSANTGKVVYSLPVPVAALPQDLRPDWFMNGSYLELCDVMGTAVETIDVSQRKKLSITGSINQHTFDQSKSHFIMTQHADFSIPGNWLSDTLIHDRATGSSISRFKNHEDWHGLRFTENGSQLKTVGYGYSAQFIDKSNGKVLLVVEPNKWHSWIGSGIGLAAIAWGALFFAQCRRARVPALARNASISIGVLSFVVYRLAVSGHPLLYDRPAWQLIEGIAWSWGLALAIWLVNSRVRLGYRFIVAMVALITCVELAGILVGDRWRYEMTGYHAVLASVLLVSTCAVLRALRWFPGNRLPRHPIFASKRLSIRSLFFLTSVIALMLGWAIRVDILNFFSALASMQNLSWTIPCLLAYWVLISTWWFTRQDTLRSVRCSSLFLVSIVSAITLHPYIEAVGWDPNYIQEELWYSSYKYLAVAAAIFIGFTPNQPSPTREPPSHIPVGRTKRSAVPASSAPSHLSF